MPRQGQLSSWSVPLLLVSLLSPAADQLCQPERWQQASPHKFVTNDAVVCCLKALGVHCRKVYVTAAVGGGRGCVESVLRYWSWPTCVLRYCSCPRQLQARLWNK